MEGGFEKETKRIQENCRFLEETAHVRNIPRYKKEDIDKRELEKWQKLGPFAPGEHLPQVTLFSRFPPTPALAHIPAFSWHSFHSSSLPPPTSFYWVPGRARSWLSWPCDFSQSIPGPPQFHHNVNSYSTTNYSQESMLDGVNTLFHFRITLGEWMPSLYKSVNWGSHTSRDHSDLICTSSPPLCFYGKQRCPESTTIFSVSTSTISRCLPPSRDAWLLSILRVLLFSACFIAHVYGALRYLHRLFRSPQDPTLWGKVPFPHFIVEETVVHRDRVACTGCPAGK